MTWYYSIHDGSGGIDVWDHTQDPETDAPLATVQNDGSGIPLPGAVLNVMYTETLDAYQSAGGIDSRAVNILADAAFEQIEEV